MGWLITVIGLVVFFTSCYIGRHKERQSKKYNPTSRMADIGFWLTMLGITILICG